MNKSEFFDEVANVIEHYGWVQGSHGNTVTGFCVLGARERVMGMDTTFDSWIRTDLWLTHFGAWIGNGCIPTWNDAEGRTKDEVILNLRKFADEVRGEVPSGSTG